MQLSKNVRTQAEEKRRVEQGKQSEREEEEGVEGEAGQETLLEGEGEIPEEQKEVEESLRAAPNHSDRNYFPNKLLDVLKIYHATYF